MSYEFLERFKDVFGINAIAAPINLLYTDAQNLQLGYKRKKSLARLVLGLSGAVMGGILPTVISKAYQQYLSKLISGIFGFPNEISNHLAIVFSVWLNTHIGLYVAKHSNRGLNILQGKSYTNDTYNKDLVKEEQYIKAINSLNEFMELVESFAQIHDYLVSQIKKDHEQRDCLLFFSLEGTMSVKEIKTAKNQAKSRLKNILKAFHRGELKPFLRYLSSLAPEVVTKNFGSNAELIKMVKKNNANQILAELNDVSSEDELNRLVNGWLSSELENGEITFLESATIKQHAGRTMR